MHLILLIFPNVPESIVNSYEYSIPNITLRVVSRGASFEEYVKMVKLGLLKININ